MRKTFLILLALPGLAQAQSAGSVFVEQADETDVDASKVYWPERPAPEPEGERPAQSTVQVAPAQTPGPLPQLTTEAGTPGVTQLSAGDASAALAQLSEGERQVLLEAIEGTDICARQLSIAAIRELCASRIETRSAEFRPRVTNALSPEERLLGEGLSGDRVATLERAIARLGRASASAEDFESQAIASVALTPQPPAPEQEESKLSDETRALIETIVNQFPTGPGGPP